MRGAFTGAQRTAAKLWWAIRQIFGDAAYEIYLRSASMNSRSAQDGNSPPPMSPADFYLDSLRRRYSRISRCC